MVTERESMTLNEVGARALGVPRSGATRPPEPERAARGRRRTPRWSPSRSGASSPPSIDCESSRTGCRKRPSRRPLSLHAARRGRTATSPGRVVHLPPGGLAQGAPSGLVAGADPEQARCQARRAQPARCEGARTRGQSGPAGEGAAHRAHDPGSAGKSCRAAGIQPQRRDRLLMAAQGLASQVGVAPACRALGVSRATFYRRHKVTPGHQQPRPNARPGAVRLRTRAGAQHARLPSLRRPRARRGRRHAAR